MSLPWRIFALALVLAAAPVAALAQLASRPAEATDTLDRGALFDAVVTRTFARFYDPEQITREKWIERANGVRDGVVNAPSADEAIARINALLDTLKASHFRLHTPDDLSYYILLDLTPNAPGARDVLAKQFWGNRPHYAGTGAFTTEIEGKHFIDGIMDGSPAERAGLKIGDEIVEVDGAPYHLIKSFRGKAGQTARLGIRRAAEGRVDIVAVPVTPIAPGTAFEQATKASARIIQSGAKRVGYFRIWAQFNDTAIIQAMARLSPGGRIAMNTTDRNAEGRTSTTVITSDVGALTNEPLDGIIIDMRGKVGGRDSSETLLGLLDQTRKGAPYFFKGRPRGDAPAKADPRNPSFRGRSVLLTDHHTRSAGEMVSHSFRYAGMGPIVGTTTAGHVLAAGIEVMPGGYVLQVPNSRPEIDGQFLEGKGVVPDVVVERPLPYSAGADPILDAGLKRLLEMLVR